MFEKIFFLTPLFSSCFWIRDPGSGINIPDPPHWMAGCRFVDEMNADPDPDSAFLVQISRLEIQHSTKNM
jgi:hypothetical protein